MSVLKSARLSECGSYRYWLLRQWDERCETLPFIMLNPSTADAEVDDPTIRRCMGFARSMGYGGITVLNLYAYRATDPTALLTCLDAVGPQNDAYLSLSFGQRAKTGSPVVAAWGAQASPSRVAEVWDLLPDGLDVRCLGVTKDGHPRHPLYVKGDQPLIPWSPK